jgi:type IV fimbrial biogenesis protein FimT
MIRTCPRRGNGAQRRPAGFTLVELMVALAIASGLLMLTGVSTRDWLPRMYQRHEAEALVHALQLARSEAIKRGHRVDVCPSANLATCDAGPWDHGRIVFADADRDGQRDPGEGVVRVEPAAGHGVTVRANRPVARYVSFTAEGHARMTSGALQMGTFTVCLRGQTAIDVVLANGGRPRLTETTTLCP